MSQPMQRINITGFGGIDVLHTESAPIPQPQAGEILIKTAYAGVNRPDIMQREGKYPLPEGVTPIMGLELAGEVTAVGAGVNGLFGQFCHVGFLIKVKVGIRRRMSRGKSICNKLFFRNFCKKLL